MSPRTCDARTVVYRSSVTGRFVTEKYAEAHESTTERQHICPPAAVRPPSKKPRVHTDGHALTASRLMSAGFPQACDGDDIPVIRAVARRNNRRWQ
jgi:hypothetical protein